MAIEPGQPVPSGQCTRVGNFPLSMLRTPTAVRTDPHTFGSILPQVDDIGTLPAGTTEKQRYLDAFSANNLTVCDRDSFAIKHTPLRVSLGSTPSLIVTLGFGKYLVSTYGGVGYFSDIWEKRWDQDALSPGYIQDFTGAGSVEFDLQNGPGIVYDHYVPGIMGPFYENQYFRCNVLVDYSVDDITSETPIVTVNISITFSNDDGTSVITNSSSGIGAANVWALDSITVPWTSLLYPGVIGFLTRAAEFSIWVNRVWGYPAP